RKDLPKDVDPPVVDRFDINAIPILYLGLQGDRSPRELRFLADHAITYQLSQVEGVGQVQITGGDVREIQARVDKARLQAYGVGINDVVAAVFHANANIPSGHVTEGARDYDARLIGEFASIDELRSIRIPVQGAIFGQPVAVYLSDVATVEDTIA